MTGFSIAGAILNAIGLVGFLQTHNLGLFLIFIALGLLGYFTDYKLKQRKK